MPVKFFCNECGKEIWQGVSSAVKERETVADMEKLCICSDCSIKINQGGLKGGENSARLNNVEQGGCKLCKDESDKKS